MSGTNNLPAVQSRETAIVASVIAFLGLLVVIFLRRRGS